MRIKHWQGYGIINAFRIKDRSATLHIQVKGNHEYGIECPTHIVYDWLVRRFDKSFDSQSEWEKRYPKIETKSSYDYEKHEDVCDYYFYY